MAVDIVTISHREIRKVDVILHRIIEEPKTVELVKQKLQIMIPLLIERLDLYVDMELLEQEEADEIKSRLQGAP